MIVGFPKRPDSKGKGGFCRGSPRCPSMDAISAAVLGGTSLAGGVGTIIGTLLGALIMAVLNSGLSLLGAQSHVQILVKGIVIIFAVLMDNALKSRTTVIQVVKTDTKNNVQKRI